MEMPKSPRSSPNAVRVIDVLTYPAVQLLDVTGPVQVFASANDLVADSGGERPYLLRVVAQGGKGATASAGVTLVAGPLTQGGKALDTLLVAGGEGAAAATENPVLVDWVRQRAAQARRAASVCTGAFLLAAAGVLDGRRAATHWMHAPLLATRHPRVTVEPDAIFVRDGMVWSSAGVTTGIDLALALIQQDAGRELAIRVARILVVYLRRSGGQSQYSALLAAQAESESETFSDLERWISEHLTSDLKVEALAERAHMSPRNFARAYGAKRGRTPAKAVEAIRVDAARRRLEETDERVESIAQVCGFSSEEQMRCAFLRNMKIPPREYRRRFASVVAPD